MRAKKISYFAETSIRELPQSEEILRKHPDLEWIDDYQSFRQRTVAMEKQCVVFARKRGAWVKPFYCYEKNPRYDYYSLDLAEGCLFDCVYCYLQTYLNHQALVLFLEEPSLYSSLEQQPRSWISTGLLSDSFLAEEYYPLLSKLSGCVPENSILEVRSKSCEIPFLSDPEIKRERVVLSWSCNPQEIVNRYEYQTASLTERLDAARKAVDAGFSVGFHLDPIFHYADWKKGYQNLFRQLSGFSNASVAFISIGLFRYMPDLGSVIRKRFPAHEALSGEFFIDEDGKYHYFRRIRKQMYAEFTKWLEPWRDSTPVFWSMEPDERLTTEAQRH